ncbi:MAG TPA: MFS transporter [Candidatus Binataceae bacterium]|nr:MFS transporter [Candidatus Binataceae bacterium]
MNTEESRSRYRFVIEALLVVALASQTLTWLAPAPLLSPIIKDLHIHLGEAGLIISVIALCIAIFSLAGAVVAEKLGALRALILGLWLLAIGGIGSGYAPNIVLLLLCRVVEGIGFGVMIAPPATMVMQWFNENEWPYMNTINAVAPFVGLTAAFALTGPVYLALGSQWKTVLLVYGLFVATVAVLWTILGRSAPGHAQVAGHGGGGSLGEVLAMRDVRLVAIALFSGMWVFQLYSAFLPQFFQTVRGMSLERAGSLTALLPLAGVFAAAGGGVLSGMVGLRRPFTYPIQALLGLGCLGCVLFTDINAIRLSLIVLGIGSSAGLSTIFTLMMELPGMTPTKAGTGLGVVWGAGYAGAFLSPFLCGALAGKFGLTAVMLGSLAFMIIAVGGFYLVPETGRGRMRLQEAAAQHVD